jgi:ribosomal protein S18 acetylase RimI-like enzyme
MTIEIQPSSDEDQDEIAAVGGSFLVTEELDLSLSGGVLSYSARPVTPYRKTYPSTYGQATAKSQTLVALIDGDVAGLVRLSENWNRFALIEDLRVDTSYRRRGVGTALIGAAIDWARARGLSGVTLETQNNNAAACRLYQGQGFVLAGFDANLYRGLERVSGEIALFWYLVF